jgi:alpha-L-fucosidase
MHQFAERKLSTSKKQRADAASSASGATVPDAASPRTPSFDIPPVHSPKLAWWRAAQKSHDKRMAWWREARFGLFIHWGVYSDLAGVWQGNPVEGYAEHIQRKARIPMDVYRREVVARFNPTKFDADAWAQLAKDAGMGYLVITTKHHDGFAMFDSDVNEYNVVKASAWRCDPMRELKAATERAGIKFGVYYSQAWDWGEPDGAGNDWEYAQPGGDLLLHGGRNWWEVTPEMVATTAKYVDRKAIPQVRELIAKYDPALIWFDTANRLPPSENLRILRATREAGPNVVVSSRCVPELADYSSTADRPAELPPHEGDWEAIPTTNESYGYHRADRSHKPVAHFIEILAKTAARGGNLMLNVGPRGDGTIDEADVAILQGIGRWMKANGASIRGTTRTPLTVQPWGESTRKGNALYLHVFDWPRDGKLIVGGLKSNVTRAYLLADPTQAPLAVTRVGEMDWTIAVPADAPDETDSVVVLVCADDDVRCDDHQLLLGNRPNHLRAFDGRLEGPTIRFGQGKRENAYVEQWRDPEDSIAWAIRPLEAAEFEVTVTYDAQDDSRGGTFEVSLGDQSLRGTVEPGKERTLLLGKVHLRPQSHTIAIRPVRIAGAELMCLRNVTLSPIGP